MSETAPSRRPLWSRILGTFVGALILMWVASAAGVVLMGTYDGARGSGRHGDAIVVLGAAQYAGRPSPVLKARLDHAIAVWKAGGAPMFICTGGMGTGDTTSEAAVSGRYATRHGVADSAVLLETEGRTTSESLRSVAAIMKAHGIRRVVLVSDPFHMLRLRILAWRYGLSATTSPTRSSPISSNREMQWAYVFAESLKVPVALIFEHGGD